MIYLDYAATTPMREEAIEVYSQAAKNYIGNPSSIHDFGTSASNIVDKARSGLAQLFNGKPRGLFFTGSGSEANQLALFSLAKANSGKGKHIISTGSEHSCVRNSLAVLGQEGFQVSWLQPDNTGVITTEELLGHLRDDTVLVSIHHGNSEIGTIQNLKEIGTILKEREVLFHSDCVQTFGKIPIDVESMNLDSISVSAHKIYGPKGVGAAYIKPSVRWKSVTPGTTQEKGFRPGTVNTPGVASFLAAARLSVHEMDEEYRKHQHLREILENKLKELPFDITFEGHPEQVLPNIIGLRIHGIEGQYAMLECNRHGLAISTGSACSVGTEKASATMMALQRTEQEAREFIRLSLGKKTTEDDINRSVQIINKVLTEHFEMVKLNKT